MVRHRGWLYLYIVAYCYALFMGVAVGASENERLFSENTTEIFIQQAQEIARQDSLDPQGIEQAMTFLNAASALDEVSAVLPEQILKIAVAGCYGGHDYSQAILWALERQVSVRADLEVLTGAVRCLLDRQNSRLDREVLLEKLLKKYAESNKAFGSDLATQLGLLTVEKADMQSAINWLAYAYELNSYNRLAFIKLQELSLEQELSLKPEVYLLQLRSALDLNPYDLNQVLLYAETLKRMRLYGLAGQAYEYAAKLYMFSLPGQPLDEAILVPWILCYYHTPRYESKCIQVTDQYRDSQRFNLMLEAVAGRAALKLGQVEKGKAVLKKAGEKAEKLLSEKGLMQPIYPEQLAWYYSFVLGRPEKALAWANQAYKEAPRRQGVQEIFAYTLAQSGQMELAEEYARPSQETSQIAALTVAITMIDEQNDPNGSTVLGLLKSAISMQPESFVAEKAVQILKDQGSDYVMPASAALAQAELAKIYEDQIVPDFVSPRERFSAKLLFSGSEFFYGNDFTPKLIIENTASGPLTIGSGSLLEGRLRVDVSLTGDLNVEVPNLLSMQFRPSRPILPAEHVSIPLPVDTGKLRKLLQTYPQADVDISFTVYLDPSEKENQTVENALSGTEPVRGQIHRSGVLLTRDFLMQRLDALARGKQGQQLRAVKLLIGLLAEQQAFEVGQADFQYVQVERTLLVDSVRRGLRDENWKVRVQALESLTSLAIPLDSDMVQEVSPNLNHEKWPVRLMAMVLLAKAQPDSFQKVLDWIAEHDPDWLNRRMAIALGAKEPKSIQGEPKS